MTKIEKILIIDDKSEFLTSINHTISEGNYQVIISNNAYEALDILKKDEDIQVLLIDLIMPNYSGMNFLEDIKEWKRPLQRIVLTAHDEELDEKKARELKIFSYLTKPPRLHSLLFTLKSAFNEIELREARQWEDLASITTETVHLIGNKISPIRRRIDEIDKTIIELHSENKLNEEYFDKIKRDIEIIMEAAEQVHSIKSDLIEGTISKKPVKIIEILNKVIMQTQKEYNKVEINVSVQEKTSKIIADEKIIRRVLEYILKNSIQAIEDKNISATNQDKSIFGTISIKTYFERDHLCIDFEDNGCGIEDQDINEIFKPFFTTKGADRGSGVGLYFCKRMMEDIGGEIKVKRTKVGIGTTFSLKFPLPLANSM